MATEIDRYLVDMQFNNADFEKGAGQSLRTIDKLKQALQFQGAERGIEAVQDKLKSFSFTALNNGLLSASNGFTAMQAIALGAFTRIGSAVAGLGMKIAAKLGDELVVKQFRTGIGKYEAMTKSVQTIMAATGKTIEEVTGYTDKLNWFTDETSFNLTDMTDNISKFTSAGIDLGKATVQMMGIGNASALAGSSIQNASHAMMGFSKAMAAGYMSRLQWNWIETAHMDTMQFKQTLIDAAVALGQLEKSGDNYYAKDVKHTEDHIVNAERMRETLSDKWLTKEVMERALAVYGEFSNVLGDFYDEVGAGANYTTNDLLKFIDEYHKGSLDLQKMSKLTGISVEDLTKRFEQLDKLAIEGIDDKGNLIYTLGRRSYAAAQEAITLRQAWEALGDAMSTGWMRSFQLIFGNYTEAKELWTQLANWLYDMFAESGNTRNALLEEWHISDSGGYKDFIKSLYNIMDTITTLRDTLQEVFGRYLPSITVDNLTGVTSKFLTFTENLKNGAEYLQNTRDIFDHLFPEVAEASKEATKLLDSYQQTPAANQSTPKLTGNETAKNIGHSDFVQMTDVVKNAQEFYNRVLNPKESNHKDLTNFIAKDPAIRAAQEFYNQVLNPDNTTRKDLDGYIITKTGREMIANARASDEYRAELSRSDRGARVRAIEDDIRATQEFYNDLYDKQESARSKRKIGLDTLLYGEGFETSDTGKKMIEEQEKAKNRWKQLADTLSGIQATFRIIRTTAEEAWSSIKKIFEPAKILGDDLLNLLGAVGRRMVKIGDDLVGNNKISEFFAKFTSTAEGPVKKAIDFIHDLLKALTDFIDPDVESGTSEFADNIVKTFSGLFDGLRAVFARTFPVLHAAWDMVKTILTGAFGGVKDFFADLDFSNITEKIGPWLKFGFLAFLTDGIKNIAKIIRQNKDNSFGDFFHDLFFGGGVSDGGKDEPGFLENIGDSFKSFAQKISDAVKEFADVKVLKEFANSILKIALAFVILAAIPVDDLNRAWPIVAGMIAAVAGLIIAVTKLKFSDIASVTAIGTAIAGLGTGLLFIAGALFVLTLLDPKKMWNALGALAIIVAELGVVIGVLSTLPAAGMLAAAASFLIIAPAILVIAGALAVMALIPVRDLTKATKALTDILVSVGLMFMVLSNTVKPGRILAVAAAFLILSPALLLIAGAVAILSSLKNLDAGLAGMFGLLLEIGLFLGALSVINPVGMIAVAAAMLILAPALVIMSAALVLLALCDYDMLAGGLKILAGALGLVVVMAALAGLVVPGLLALSVAFLALGASTVLLGTGLLMISAAVSVVVLAVSTGITMIVNAITGLVSIFTGAVNDTVGKAEEGGSAMSLSLIDGLKRTFNINVGEVARNIVDGFVQGVKNFASRIWSAATTLYNTFMTKFKKLFGIASPSKVMANEMQYIVSGMGVGIDRNSRAIGDIGSSMAQTLLDASDDTFAGYEPSLSPVLDLSGVQSGNLSFGATLTPNAVRSLATVSADIREQRNSMNDYINNAVNSAINGMKDQLTFVVPLEVDGRQFAKSTARFTRDETSILDRNTMRKGGLI